LITVKSEINSDGKAKLPREHITEILLQSQVGKIFSEAVALILRGMDKRSLKV
jgi:hypothetical protein